MKKTIALITGGYSGEAVISYKSAEAMYKNIDKDKWDCYMIDIHPSGWTYKDENGKKHFIDKNDFSLNIGGNKIKFDAVLVGLHGTPGEDGKLQGYFDCLGLPYTSCDSATSALTFNKRYTVAVAAFAGLPVAKSMHLFKNNLIVEDEILEQLSLPLFVKPNNGGSSIGISKVNKASELGDALCKAFKEDDQVLVEEFIAGREFTIGVFRSKGEIITLPITEIISKKEFFDFEAKYEGASDEITPANVDASVAAKIRLYANQVYALFNCKGIVRMDFIYDEAKSEPVLLEINTVPGQSEASLVPQQVVAMGWTLKEFYSALIEECFLKQ
jgi:D-alanine-D-alanine ligase